MKFSFQDIYPNLTTVQNPTATQTIPEEEENQDYVDSTSTNDDGMVKTVETSKIFGAFALLIGLLVVLHFME